MKKITTILSPLVLLATTALAQDSTCILQPSCSQLGYTSSETDCGTQKVLRCPFDVSQVACVGGSSGAGGDGGSGGDGDYNPNDPNNELGDVIALKFVLSSSGNIKFTYGGGSIFVDCGEGTIVGGSAGSSGTISCTYTTAGTYTVKLSGDFTYYGGSNPAPTSLIKLDKSGITKMSNVCGNGTNGVVPPLPSTLKDATNMFYDCYNINSSYPKLPDGLEIADNMFSSSGSMTETKMLKFSGSVALPSSLKSVSYMFKNNVTLNQVSGLENLQITDGKGMFYWAVGLTSISALPSTLTNGTEMFYGAGLTELPTLPSGIIYANYMFGTHYNYGVRMTGTLPNLPDSIVEAESMFANQNKITGTLTKLPANLTMARHMFERCSGITGSPTQPAGLTTYVYDMFADSGISQEDNPSWPPSAW